MKESKRLNKEKIDITHDINLLTEEIQQLTTQIQKHEESLKECEAYKVFLDKITSHEHGPNLNNSEQLMEIFHELVEQNLLLIQNIQEVEQTLETSKHELEKLEREREEKLLSLDKEKQTLDKEIEEKERRCAQLSGRLHKSLDNERSGLPI